MPVLSQKQIEYGFDYFHKDEPQSKCIVEVSEYNGENALTVNCTQLGDSFTPQYKSAKEKKRVLQEWCDFLQSNKTAFTALSFCTRMPQNYLMLFVSRKILENYILNGVYILILLNLQILINLSIYNWAQGQVLRV